MRTIALLLSIVLAACAVSAAEDPVFIEGFAERSIPVDCEPIPDLTNRGGAVRDLAVVDDSALIAVHDIDREVVIIGPDLVPRHQITLPSDGPTGVHSPASATLFGDSLLYVADPARMQLRVFDLQGGDRGTIELDFVPQTLRPAGDRLLILPLVISNTPNSLLFELVDEEVRSLPVNRSRYRDALVNTFANTATAVALDDGRIVVAQRVVVPFAQVLEPGIRVPARIPLPLPDGVRDRYGWLPTSKMTEEDAPKLLFVSIATAPDLRSGDLIYLTKTGGGTLRAGEKALIRVDPQLQFLRSYTLNVNATRFAYLAASESSIVTTSDGEWFRCETP